MRVMWFAWLALMMPAQLAAQEPPPADNVVVHGGRPFRIEARTLRVARETFDKGLPTYAPGAVLMFELRRVGEGAIPADLTLELVAGTRAIPLPIDARGRFSLPPLPPGRWQVLGNRPLRGLTVRPLVLSPAAPEPSRRLGDLRLQCRVMWSMIKAEASVLMMPLIAAADAAGPCSTRRVGIYLQVPRPIVTAEWRDGARVVPAEITPQRRAHRAPIYDRTLSNDARVHLTLERGS